MNEPESTVRSIGQEAAGPAYGETAGKWTVLLIVDIGIFMATLDASIVNISLLPYRYCQPPADLGPAGGYGGAETLVDPGT